MPIHSDLRPAGDGRSGEDVLWEAVVLMLPAFDLLEQMRSALTEDVVKGLISELNAVDEHLFGVLFEVNPTMLEESEDEALARDQRERERHAGAFDALGLDGGPRSQMTDLLGVMRRRLGSLLLSLDIEADLDLVSATRSTISGKRSEPSVARSRW